MCLHDDTEVPWTATVMPLKWLQERIFFFFFFWHVDKGNTWSKETFGNTRNARLVVSLKSDNDDDDAVVG